MKIFHAIIGFFFLVSPCIAEEPVTFSDKELKQYRSAPMFEEDPSFKGYQENLRRENEKIFSDMDEREAKRKAEIEEREKAQKEEEEENAIQDSVVQDGDSNRIIVPRPRPRPRPH